MGLQRAFIEVFWIMRTLGTRWGWAAVLLTWTACRAQWQAISFAAPGAYYDSQIHALSGGTQGGEAAIGGVYRPMLWSGTPGSWIDLSPYAGSGGRILGMCPTEQVGTFGRGAALWHGTAESWVNLSPAGVFLSEAHATDGTEQVGRVDYTGLGPLHAALWRGTAQSFVDLNPPGAYTSGVSAVLDGVQGGGLQWSPQTFPHAAIWHGSATSWVDLHPDDPGVAASGIVSMTAGQQAGAITHFSNFNTHAAIWLGTPASCRDINPPNAALSTLTATCGVAQAGYANIGGVITAGVWFGTPESFERLDTFLPQGIYYQSIATLVAVVGDTVYAGGYASNGVRGYDEGFLWVGPVPAPGGLTLCACAGLFAMRRERGAGDRAG
jgi:hypothetical protein